MREIGRIIRLQIQRQTLKTGVKPTRVYDPTPILDVPRLALTPDGALGAGPDDSWIVDVHHRAHPASKNPDGQHGVSVGFTAHYTAMRERLGARITLGCAGENIIAESHAQLGLDDLAGGLVIVDGDGTPIVQLTVLQVAHPCRPFTGWALGTQVEPDVLRSHLQFLDDGMRGFYCLAEDTAVVAVGDRIIAR